MMGKSNSEVAPSCPSCDGPMVLRKNSRDGSSFWGCRSYPACRGTRDATSESGETQAGVEESPPQVRVLWNDATLDRSGWQCRYTTAGGRLRSSPALTEITNEFRQCWIARTRGGSVAPENVRRVTGAIRKLIQRGSNPPIHPEAEREFLRTLELDAFLSPSTLPGDLSVRLEPDVFEDWSGDGLDLHGQDFVRDKEVRLESEYESHFIDNWVPRHLGPGASRWFVPQAEFDALTAGLGDYSPSGRRVDFLVNAPFRTPFVVEIDGPQHRDSLNPDGERDHLLAQVGLEVVRVPTTEIDQGYGSNLERIRALWAKPQNSSDSELPSTLMVPQSIHRLVIALLDAVEAGFLGGRSWVVEIEGEPNVTPSMLWPYVRLFEAMDRLWGPSIMPEEIFLKTRRGWTRFDIPSSQQPVPCEPHEAEPNVIIRLQPFRTGFDKLERPKRDVLEIVVRSARLPVIVRDDLFEPGVRTNLSSADPQDMEPALTEVLQAIFAKESFREGQLEALVEIMEGRDCTVLLPTGGGKSLIYQMAGICKPGRTIVVDPLIALIEDQQRGLAEHGIDRVVGFSSFEVSQGRLESLLRQVVSGDAFFIFVAPERFQQQSFRESIRSLTQATSINLAVIDEAHCVSEWGHQFRSSYLTLGRVLREVCKDPYGVPPALLALTGTASRAVLKDVLAQLGLSTDSERSIVRPSSFDRKELKMGTLQCNPGDARAVLTGSLISLPARFGVPATEFFRPRNERTYSGLIFCPHVNGQYGIMALQQATAGVVGFLPAMYSGSSPKVKGQPICNSISWEIKKREFAENFKSNRVPLMVSTNAFGMGIDKPNIRYVLHYGMPGSLEAYYQEVGRAGRDQEMAICLLIWNERDRLRSDRLTIMDGSLEGIRREHDSIQLVDSDSITQQLYFLLNTFKGVEVELAEVERVVDDKEFLPNLGSRKAIKLAKGTAEEANRRERAIYRLMLLGVVEDYLVESSEFVVNLDRISSPGVAEALVEFINRTAPGSQRLSVDELARQANEMELRETVAKAARELIDFIYDVIVESRRRSLREMYVAVRDTSPEGDELRDRVLDYLTRGDMSPVLEALLEATEFSYESWEEELSKLEGVEDARELRGNSARLLASSPFNPGLLFARAYAEIIHPEGDLQDFRSNLDASISSARERFGVSESALNEFAKRILLSLESDSYDGIAEVVDAVERLGLATETTQQIEERALNSQGSDIGVRVLVLANKMRQLSNDLSSTIGSAAHGR